MHRRLPILAFADDYAALLMPTSICQRLNFPCRTYRKPCHSWKTAWHHLGMTLAMTAVSTHGERCRAALGALQKTTGGAEPSANGLAALALIRLDLIFDRPDFRQKAEQCLKCCKHWWNERLRRLVGKHMPLAGCSILFRACLDSFGLTAPWHA